jgi:hypothetical protein
MEEARGSNPLGSTKARKVLSKNNTLLLKIMYLSKLYSSCTMHKSMSRYYDTMQVCRKWGHKITDMYDSYPNDRQKFCKKCGSNTVYKCLHCDTKMKGYYHVERVIGGSKPEVPLNCHECGKPYPWQRILFIKKIASVTVSYMKYLIDAIVGVFKK